MLLIEACPVPTPADAERLLAAVWQLTAGRGVGLYLLGLGDRVMLGVHSAHAGLEQVTASLISDQCGAAVEPGWMVAEMVGSAAAIAAVNLVPAERHLALESRTFGWQRTDPLRGTFLTLANPSPGTVTGVAVSLRAVPELGFAVSLGVFAAGTAVADQVARLSASFGGIGVRLRRPLHQGRAVRRMLTARLRRPASVRRVEVVARFWHPPYGLDAELPMPVRAAAVAGHLGAGTDP